MIGGPIGFRDSTPSSNIWRLPFCSRSDARCGSRHLQILYMRSACFYVVYMSVMIQIRNVPDALHRRLKSRAALEGMSLSDYLLAELRRVAERPSLAELRERLQKRPATDPDPSPEEAIRAERDSR